MMDIFEKLNRQAVLIKKQSFKALRNRLFLACQQYKTDAQFTVFFNELLCTENYQDIVNAIKLIKINETYKDRLLHFLDIEQFYVTQESEINDHITLTQFN